MISHIRLRRSRVTNIRATVITARGEISFKMFDLPQSVIEIMVVFHSDSFVFSPDVLGAHGGFPNCQGVSFALSKYGHHCTLLTVSHPGIGVSQA